MIQVRNDENSFHPPGRTTCTCTRWKRPRWRRKGTTETETVNTRHLLREVKKLWTWMPPGIPLAPVNCEFLLCLHLLVRCHPFWLPISIIIIYYQCHACLGSLGIYYTPQNTIEQHTFYKTKYSNVFLGSMLGAKPGPHLPENRQKHIWWNSHWHGTLSGLSDCMFLSV